MEKMWKTHSALGDFAFSYLFCFVLIEIQVSLLFNCQNMSGSSGSDSTGIYRCFTRKYRYLIGIGTEHWRKWVPVPNILVRYRYLLLNAHSYFKLFWLHHLVLVSFALLSLCFWLTFSLFSVLCSCVLSPIRICSLLRLLMPTDL
ncbi:hypothetical protein Hdeb2414_s0005g00183461 [Helianthus debilis subsp. tardiflorus]